MQGCRLERLNNGGPVLDSHAAYGVESQLGVVRKAWTAGATGKATIQFSKRDGVTPVWNDVQAGIIQNLSPGMWIYKKVDTTPKGQERKEFTAVDWEPFEISLVPVPGDANTTFMSAEHTRPPAQPNVVAERASAQKETPVEPITQDAGDVARQNDALLAAARDEAMKAERLRATTIRTMATPFHLEETFVTSLVEEGLAVEIARERIMTKLAAQYTDNPTNGINSQVTMGADATDKRRKGMEAGILFRGNRRARRSC
jgi:predicted DNA-binding ribbon-helix-helix protein